MSGLKSKMWQRRQLSGSIESEQLKKICKTEIAIAHPAQHN